MRIERVGDTKDVLGEGPLWHPGEQALYWVDIKGKVMHRYEPASGAHAQCATPLEIGSFAFRRAGGLVIAAEDRFHRYSFGDTTAEPLCDALCDLAHAQFNDGKTDRQGRFIAGTLSRDHARSDGVLYRLSPGGAVEAILDGFHVTNGPAFSPDGATFYFSDSPTREISAYDYPAEGPLGARRTFVDTNTWNTAPDGGTVDAEGYVWSALVLRGQIGRFAPDGRLDRLIEMPVSHPTSVAFGGPDLDILYVTSLAVALRSRPPGEPEAGALYAIHDLGITGLEEPFFGG